MQKWVWSLGQEDPLETGMTNHSSIPAWKNSTDRGAWRAKGVSFFHVSKHPLEGQMTTETCDIATSEDRDSLHHYCSQPGVSYEQGQKARVPQAWDESPGWAPSNMSTDRIPLMKHIFRNRRFPLLLHMPKQKSRLPDTSLGKTFPVFLFPCHWLLPWLTSWASQAVQWQRIHLPMQEMQEMRVLSLCQKDPLEKGMAPHSSIFEWRIPWTEEPGGLQSMGSQKSLWDTPEHCIGLQVRSKAS